MDTIHRVRLPTRLVRGRTGLPGGFSSLEFPYNVSGRVGAQAATPGAQPSEELLILLKGRAAGGNTRAGAQRSAVKSVSDGLQSTKPPPNVPALTTL